MFVRFVVLELCEDLQCELGLFSAAYERKRDGLLSDYEEEWLTEITQWFDQHLEAPLRLSRSRRRSARPTAVCWLKDTAHEHIARIRDLVVLLEYCGIHTRMIATRRPGYIVHEDEYQIAAVPFRDAD